MRDPIDFYTRQIYGAVMEPGVNEQSLCYLLVFRSEKDLLNIQNYFNHLYRRSLQEMIQTYCNEDMAEILLLLLGTTDTPK